MSFFLQEQPLIQEADIQKIEPGKAIFRMVIQTADDKNRNGRVYPRDVLEQAIRDCESMIRGRSFYGELDHPLVTGNSAFDEQRQTTVLLKETCHIIRDCDWQGNLLIGEFETLSNRHGKDLLALIKDRTAVGVSMRGLAELDRRPDGNYVKGPLTIISYDIVSRPSHKSAVIDERQVRFENLSMIQESQRTVCINGKCFLPNYLDQLVETNIIKFYKKWI